jgi:DNA-binding transcriptional LysR family regulator
MNISEVDWNLIRSFVAVAQTGSLSAAARELGGSQPTLGRHVAGLERALGLKLFRRGRAGYDLTDDGLALLARAEEMSDRANAFMRAALGASTEQVSGTVRIAASEVVAAYVLPPIMARLGEIEPAIEVEIVASNRVENLLRRDADVAIRMVEPAQQDLIARKVTDIPLCACAAASYLDRRGRPSSFRELPQYDMIGFDRDGSMIDAFGAFGLKIDRHAFRFRTDNQIVGWEAVRAGNGIGFGQRPLALADPLVEMILPDLTLPELPVWLAMHRDVRTSARIRLVVDFLHAELKRYADV